MGDVTAVLDEIGSERAVVFGSMEGGSICALFAATYPHRTLGLILHGSLARGTWAPDYPWGSTEEAWREDAAKVERTWDTTYPDDIIELVIPSLASDPGIRRWFASDMHMAATASGARSLKEMFKDIDIRPVLPAIHVPTLVLHAQGDRVDPIEEGRYLADRIAGARFVELPGDDHLPWGGDRDAIVGEVEGFLMQVEDEEAEFGRVLATVLFTDIAGSTERAVSLGDRRWRELLETHHAKVRGLLARYRGTEIDTAGDGFLATLDGPEILVSSTVKDLVAGSGLRFRDHGLHRLKGIPDQWQLFEAIS